MVLYGPVHPTAPNYIDFTGNSDVLALRFNGSDTWNFQDNAITTTGALTCDAFTTVDPHITMTAGAAIARIRGDNTGTSIYLEGGTGTTDGSRVEVHGAGAAAAGDVWMYGLSNEIAAQYDYSADTWKFQDNAITTTGAINASDTITAGSSSSTTNKLHAYVSGDQGGGIITLLGLEHNESGGSAGDGVAIDFFTSEDTPFAAGSKIGTDSTRGARICAVRESGDISGNVQLEFHTAVNSADASKQWVIQSNGTLTDDGLGHIITTTGSITGGNIYPGGQTVGHLRSVSGNYGSVETIGADGTSSSWHGYSIGGRAVFMDNAGTATTNRVGLYDDLNNQWLIQFNADAAGSNETQLYYNGAAKLETTSTGISVTGNVVATANTEDQYGPMRGNPWISVDQTAAYTFPAAATGRTIGVGPNIPSSMQLNTGVFVGGDTITVWNGTTSDISITEGSGFTLRLAGTTSVGTRTLGVFGLATIVIAGGGSSAFITGAGLS